MVGQGRNMERLEPVAASGTQLDVEMGATCTDSACDATTSAEQTSSMDGSSFDGR